MTLGEIRETVERAEMSKDNPIPAGNVQAGLYGDHVQPLYRGG